MYYIYGVSVPSLLIESTDYDRQALQIQLVVVIPVHFVVERFVGFDSTHTMRVAKFCLSTKCTWSTFRMYFFHSHIL